MGVVRGKRGSYPLDFEIDFCYKHFSGNMSFSQFRRMAKNGISPLLAPLEKLFWSHPRKIHYCPPEKILPTPVSSSTTP